MSRTIISCTKRQVRPPILSHKAAKQLIIYSLHPWLGAPTPAVR